MVVTGVGGHVAGAEDSAGSNNICVRQLITENLSLDLPLPARPAVSELASCQHQVYQVPNVKALVGRSL